jgi:hypothetical protein
MLCEGWYLAEVPGDFDTDGPSRGEDGREGVLEGEQMSLEPRVSPLHV